MKYWLVVVVGLGYAQIVPERVPKASGGFTYVPITSSVGNVQTTSLSAGDVSFAFGLNSGNPQIVFDANDYVQFNRSRNRLDYFVGATSGLSVDRDGSSKLGIPPVSALWTGGQKTITNAYTSGSELRIDTSGAHGLAVNVPVAIVLVGGCTNANGYWRVKAVVDTDTVSLKIYASESDATCNSAYTSGGVMSPFSIGLQVALNGTASPCTAPGCDDVLSLNHAGLGYGAVQAFSSNIIIPAGASIGTATTGFGSAISGNADSSSADATPVGGYFRARNRTSNSYAAGINPVCQTYSGTTGQYCFAIDANVVYENAADSVYTLRAYGSGPTAPTTPTESRVIDVGYVDGANYVAWEYGMRSEPGGMLTAVYANTQERTANPSNSATYQMVSRNSGGVEQTTQFYTSDHKLKIEGADIIEAWADSDATSHFLIAASSIKTAGAFYSIYQATSTFSGTGLHMNMGVSGGTFNGTFVDLTINNSSKWAVDAAGNTYLRGADTGIEIGSNTAANSPFIDFHTINSATDHQVRMIASGGTAATGDGTLSVLASALEVAGSVRLADAGSKPSCDVNHRGRIWHDFSADGVKDTVEICAKDAANGYAWRTIY